MLIVSMFADKPAKKALRSDTTEVRAAASKKQKQPTKVAAGDLSQATAGPDKPDASKGSKSKQAGAGKPAKKPDASKVSKPKQAGAGKPAEEPNASKASKSKQADAGKPAKRHDASKASGSKQPGAGKRKAATEPAAVAKRTRSAAA